MKCFSKDIDAGICDKSVLQGALNRIAMYDSVKSVKIDVTGKELPENAERILEEISKVEFNK